MNYKRPDISLNETFVGVSVDCGVSLPRFSLSHATSHASKSSSHVRKVSLFPARRDTLEVEMMTDETRKALRITGNQSLKWREMGRSQRAKTVLFLVIVALMILVGIELLSA